MAGKAVIVRIPATGRELDQNIWMVKQVLDLGAHGIIFPTVETPEQALMAIRAMRYPQRLGAPDPAPAGLRGTNPRLAARYWGLSVPDSAALDPHREPARGGQRARDTFNTSALSRAESARRPSTVASMRDLNRRKPMFLARIVPSASMSR